MAIVELGAPLDERPDSRGSDVRTLMRKLELDVHGAVKRDDEVTLRALLLREGPSIVASAEPPTLLSPLHMAAAADSPLLGLLLSSGVSVHLKDSLGQTPAHMAASAGKVSALRAILDVDASAAKDVDKSGSTVLHRALSSSAPLDLANLLHTVAPDAISASLAKVDRNGKSPLMVAALKGNVEAVIWTLDHGANVNQVCPGDTTALGLCFMSSRDAMVSLLLSRGADPTVAGAKAVGGWLRVAVERGDVVMVHRLLRLNPPHTTSSPTDDTTWCQIKSLLASDDLNDVDTALKLLAGGEEEDGAVLDTVWMAQVSQAQPSLLVDSLRVCPSVPVARALIRAQWAVDDRAISLAASLVNADPNIMATLLNEGRYRALPRDTLASAVASAARNLSPRVVALLVAVGAPTAEALHAAASVGCAAVIRELAPSLTVQDLFSPNLVHPTTGSSGGCEFMSPLVGCLHDAPRDGSEHHQDTALALLDVAAAISPGLPVLLARTACTAGHDVAHLALSKRMWDTFVRLASLNPSALAQTDPSSGATPLHIAVKMNDYTMVETLVSMGANLTSLDKNRRTPYDLAETCCHVAIARHLVTAAEEMAKLLNVSRGTTAVDLTSQQATEVVDVYTSLRPLMARDCDGPAAASEEQGEVQGEAQGDAGDADELEVVVGEDGLAPCTICGRRFFPDRLTKHFPTCRRAKSKENKPKRVFHARAGGWLAAEGQEPPSPSKGVHVRSQQPTLESPPRSCKSRRGLRRISPPNQLPACLLASSNPNPPPPPLPPSRSSFQTGATSAPNALAALTSRALTSTSACARRPSPRPPRRQPQQAQRPPRTPLHPLPNKDPLANKLSTPCWLRQRTWPPPRSGRSVATISPRLRL